MKMYKIVYKGKTLERLANKEVAQNIAEMYRRGEVWTYKKPINVELIEYSLN
jgi:hypothetical protein